MPPGDHQSSREAAMKRKCIECGFLGIRSIHSGDLGEATKQYRETTEPPTGHIPGKPGFRPLFKRSPECYKFACDLTEEIGGSERPEKILYVIGAERTCDDFVKWRPNRNPRSHDEMQILEEVDRRNRAAQEEWRKNDKQWRDDTEKSIERRHQENATQARIAARWNITLTVIAVLAAIASAVAAWIAAISAQSN